jgi:hypothetical protein
MNLADETERNSCQAMGVRGILNRGGGGEGQKIFFCLYSWNKEIKSVQKHPKTNHKTLKDPLKHFSNPGAPPLPPFPTTPVEAYNYCKAR